jgi:uncharacterized protein (UPF0332 family)
MTPAQENLIRMAWQSVSAARLLLREGYAGYAAARAYYTMFYVTQALLLNVGLTFSSHSAVIAAFGREFAKPEKVDPKFHRYLIDAQQVRLIADYKGTTLSIEDASSQVKRAENFLELAEQMLGVLPSETSSAPDK